MGRFGGLIGFDQRAFFQALIRLVHQPLGAPRFQAAIGGKGGSSQQGQYEQSHPSQGNSTLQSGLKGFLLLHSHLLNLTKFVM